MRYTNLKYTILVLAILSLALAACIPKTYPALIADSPTRLDDHPLCGLTLPEEDTPWRQVWRTEYTEGGVRDLIRDGDWLWVTTPVDVVRLDLRTLDCTRFGLNGACRCFLGPLDSTCRFLLDPDGRLWVAGGSELAYFDGQHWRSVSFGRDVGRLACDLAFDKRGNLWVRSCSLRPGDGSWFRYLGHEPPEDGLWEEKHVYTHWDENDCDQWFSRGGEFRSPEECRLLADWRRQLASLAPPKGIAPWGGNPLIAAESDDHLWMLAHYTPHDPRPYDALLSFDGQNWEVLPWPYGSARLVADEARGGVWAGTDEGLVFSDGRRIQKYPLTPGDTVPVGSAIYELVVDGSGHLWALTYAGLLRYDEESDIWQPTEIDEWYILLSPDYEGGLWAVSPRRNGSISHFDGNAWSHHPFPEDWPCSSVTDILADVGGRLWLSSPHCALQEFDGQVWDEYDSGSRSELLARGPDGTVYAAGRGGVIKRYDGVVWETLPPVDLPPCTRVTDLVVGPGGEVWVMFYDSNPIVYRGGEWEEFPELAGERITALLVDSQGDVWGGYSQGLLHYDGRTWELVERETPFNAIETLAKDRQGRIWVGDQVGLYVYDPTKE